MNIGITQPNAATGAPRRPAAVVRSHPGWWLYVAAALAWVALAAWTIGDSSAMHHGAHGAAHHMGGGASGDHTLDRWAASWTLMVIAMMWPLYAETTAAVARASFRRWRIANISAYLAAISGLWLLVGLIGQGVYVAVEPAIASWVWPVAWLLVAVLASRSRRRARLLGSCERLGVIAPHGRRGLVTAAVCGFRYWPRCAVLCGPVMFAMVAQHQLLLMIGGTISVWWEQRHPRARRDPVPAVVLLVTAIAVLGFHFAGSGHG
jgi:hypothetical protein